MTNTADTAFLFDLDGVLIDSEHIYTEIWTRIGEAFPTGRPSFASEIKGCTLENILATYYPDPEIRAKVEARLYEEEEKIKYKLIPGAERLLDDIKRLGVPVALVTSSNDIKMSHLWSQHPELKDMFDAIVTGDDVKESKPNPEGYLTAAYKVGAMPLRSAVIEDSLQGVKAGRNAGSYVIGISGTLGAEILAPYCDEIHSSVADIDAKSVYDKLRVRG